MDATSEPNAPGMATLLGSLDQPAEVIRVAGGWLAEELSGERFVWIKSRQTLERRVGKRKEQIHLQNSKWNRAGEMIRFDSVLNVRDGMLSAWRRANPDLTIYRGTNDDWVCGTPLGNLLTTFSDGGADLTFGERRAERLGEFLGRVRQVGLPWFGSTADPVEVDGIPRSALDGWTSDLAELMISRGDRGQAHDLVLRWLALGEWRQAEFDAGRALARQGLVPGGDRRGQVVGWSSVVLDLL